MAGDATTLTVRLSRGQGESLGALAAATGRSADDLVAEAVGAYLEAEARIAAEIEQAVREADAGAPAVDFEDVARWLRSWDREDHATGRRPPVRVRRRCPRRSR